MLFALPTLFNYLHYYSVQYEKYDHDHCNLYSLQLPQTMSHILGVPYKEKEYPEIALGMLPGLANMVRSAD